MDSESHVRDDLQYPKCKTTISECSATENGSRWKKQSIPVIPLSPPSVDITSDPRLEASRALEQLNVFEYATCSFRPRWKKRRRQTAASRSTGVNDVGTTAESLDGANDYSVSELEELARALRRAIDEDTCNEDDLESCELGNSPRHDKMQAELQHRSPTPEASSEFHLTQSYVEKSSSGDDMETCSINSDVEIRENCNREDIDRESEMEYTWSPSKLHQDQLPTDVQSTAHMVGRNQAFASDNPDLITQSYRITSGTQFFNNVGVTQSEQVSDTTDMIYIREPRHTLLPVGCSYTNSSGGASLAAAAAAAAAASYPEEQPEIGCGHMRQSGQPRSPPPPPSQPVWAPSKYSSNASLPTASGNYDEHRAALSYSLFAGGGGLSEAADSSAPASGMNDGCNKKIGCFDLNSFRGLVNEREWQQAAPISTSLRRTLVSSTPAFRFYLPSSDGISLITSGVTESMLELQQAFYRFKVGLSRTQICMQDEQRTAESNVIVNKLRNHMVRTNATISSAHRNVASRKNASAMLKQLRISVAEPFEEECYAQPSNIDKLLSCEKQQFDDCNSFHSKASRNKKRQRNKAAAENGAKRGGGGGALKTEIDSLITECGGTDELVTEQLKLDYVSFHKGDPCRLHDDIYPNEKDFHCHKPACTCWGDHTKSGPHHGFFYGEVPYEMCNKMSNNLDKLFHYVVVMRPGHHFFLDSPSRIWYEGNQYLFRGFSIFAHERLNNIPASRFSKGSTEYVMELSAEPPPSSFCVEDCDLISDFIFDNLLEFFDFSLKGTNNGGCSRFHLFPRFERKLLDSGVELLSAHVIMKHILSSFAPLIDQKKMGDVCSLTNSQMCNISQSLRDHLVMFPGKKPLCVRVDNLVHSECRSSVNVVHTTLLPSSLSFLGDKKFLNLKKLHTKMRETMQFRNDPKDIEILAELERMMDEHKKLKKATVFCRLPVDGSCFLTGLKCDITHCAVHIPRLVFHIRRHLAIQRLCARFSYRIRNPAHFEVAFTHSTAPDNVLEGTNKSHVKNSRYRVGKNMNDVPIHERTNRDGSAAGPTARLKAAKHKRNIFTMIQTMQKMPSKDSEIIDYPTTDNYERMEFLGDAVLEMIVSTHLFFMLPDAKEGILSLFRIPLVANNYLSKVSKRVGLPDHLVISHDSYFNQPGPRDKIHADILEAFLGAIFLDSNLSEADRVFSLMFFPDEDERRLWCELPAHQFQTQYPTGDRHLISRNEVLRSLTRLEDSLGIRFNHIQLLARALNSSSLSYNFVTCGTNERLEFLGDTVMKLLVTNFIYKHFPVYHENHLSTLRGNLVSRFTQEEVARELGLSQFAMDRLCAAGLSSNAAAAADAAAATGPGMTTKRKADLFEAFLAAVFVDQGLETCMAIFRACIFPKIPKLLINQRWLTPHMMLHCCLLAIRNVADFEKSLVLIPSYRILGGGGGGGGSDQRDHQQQPRNNRTIAGDKRVGVFISGKMIGSGRGKSLHQASAQACRRALTLFQNNSPHALVQLLSSRVDSILGNKEDDNSCIQNYSCLDRRSLRRHRSPSPIPCKTRKQEATARHENSDSNTGNSLYHVLSSY